MFVNKLLSSHVMIYYTMYLVLIMLAFRYLRSVS